ncbi:hypothetical protein BVC80_9083g120 [Macleaya cordata]|uniref:Uncharacterized protein n=1 Tax=Macleaya cordata TaxID=56857 RepID=A0A200PRI3_MACCD|nr:hypothetical protein BVC80_9083g120 [Macleaya cordata]
MESKHESGSSKQSTTPPEADDHLTPGKKSDSSSSSSTSDSPFNEDLSRQDKGELSESNAEASGSPKLHDSPPSPSTLTAEFSLNEMSANQSPPIQVMEREGEPTPYRIPSTVFARSPSTAPVEWSVTSNESLFSIHMGNNSFSADQIFLMGRSGELGMPGDYNNFLDNKLTESSNFPNSQSQTSAAGKESSNLGEGLGVAEAAAETMKEVLRATAEDQNSEKTPPVEAACHSSSISLRSDESGTSVVSFAFPILTGEGGRAVSAKVEPEHLRQQPKEQSKEQLMEQSKEQQQAQPPSPAPPNAAAPAQTKWFPCFSCCPFCS